MLRQDEKKKVLAIALIVMMIAVASAGSFAYFTAEETAHNVITTGGIDIELVESKMDPETGAQPKMMQMFLLE